MTETVGECHQLTQLPEELLLRLLVWMDIVELCRLSATSRWMYRLVLESGELWRRVDLSTQSLLRALLPAGSNTGNLSAILASESAGAIVPVNSTPAVPDPWVIINVNDAAVDDINGETQINELLTATMAAHARNRLREEQFMLFFNGVLGWSAMAAIRRVRLDDTGATDNVVAVLLARCKQLEWLSVRRCREITRGSVAQLLNSYWNIGKLLRLRVINFDRAERHDASLHWHFSNRLINRETSEMCLEAMRGMDRERRARRRVALRKKLEEETLSSCDASSAMAKSAKGKALGDALPIDSPFPNTHTSQLTSATTYTAGIAIDDGLDSDNDALAKDENLIEVWPMPCTACPVQLAEQRRQIPIGWLCPRCNWYLCERCDDTGRRTHGAHSVAVTATPGSQGNEESAVAVGSINILHELIDVFETAVDTGEDDVDATSESEQSTEENAAGSEDSADEEDA
ncbi:hypothetical protein THASP1DRAFT_31750 [Thamnocephalis sphaerospora]|uniref:F-box domain-containing protein n=1 Tax=Thamnocephalis sphaerospora TaxID=78915 RepID=A0A4P9XKT6_9FUNG|nr:hypothetical protein THASP1DRAFT_31750 [Thamnocephalis sphaerospora]|eukprot:RKP06434.1 hypothetical protein THASP1DRAFT_31750 [Thamnocephalis sphaerospora]